MTGWGHGRRERQAHRESDGRAQVIKNHRLVKVPNAGHWARHDALETFLEETLKFLAEP
jgi:pimeloyl-ACP methyl ester carboxylesterase